MKRTLVVAVVLAAAVVGSGGSARSALPPPQSFVAHMTADQVVSSAGDTGATGSGKFVMSYAHHGQVCYKLTFSGISPTTNLQLVIGKGKKGSPDDVAEPQNFIDNSPNIVSGVRRCVTGLDASEVKQMEAWANHHNAYALLEHFDTTFHGGIRGQMKRV